MLDGFISNAIQKGGWSFSGTQWLGASDGRAGGERRVPRRRSAPPLSIVSPDNPAPPLDHRRSAESKVARGAGEPGAAETEGVIETEATAEATTNEPAEARLLAWANARAMDVRGWPWREHHMESLSDPLIAHGRWLLAVAASVAPDCVAYEHVQDSQSEGSSGGGGGGGGGGDGGCDPAARRRNACYALSVAWRAGLPLGASYSDITAGKPSIIAMYLGLFARLAAGTDG